MRAGIIFTSCAVAACLAAPALAQSPPQMDTLACASAYDRLANAAYNLYFLVPKTERDYIASLAGAASDAASLVNLHGASANRLCAVGRITSINTLATQLGARHDRLEVTREQRRIADIEALIAKELAAAPPDPPPES